MNESTIEMGVLYKRVFEATNEIYPNMVNKPVYFTVTNMIISPKISLD